MLDNRVLEKTDTVKFIRENPHCMVVLIGARSTKLGNMSVEVITAEELGATSVDWDTECLHWMTQAFSAEAAQRHKVKPAVQWAKSMVDEKLESSNQRFDSKLYATELYLTTAYLLIDFLRSEEFESYRGGRAVQPALQRRPAGLLHAADRKRRTDTGHPAVGGEF